MSYAVRIPRVSANFESLGDALCPLPRCGAVLYINWTATRPVFLSDTAEDLRSADAAYTSGWEIGCEEGHTVLLPVNLPGQARDEEVFGENQEEGYPTDLDRLHEVLNLAVIGGAPA